MKDIGVIFDFLTKYKLKVTLSLLCHVMMAVFTIISIPLIIPFFHFLFSTTPKSAEQPKAILDVIGWLEYYFVRMIDQFGASKALMITCGFLVVTFFLKNLFRYLAMVFMIPVRSSIMNDLRSRLYHKYINLAFDTKNHQHNRGDLIARMTSDVQEVEFSILRFVQTMFKAPILIVGSVFLMLSIHKGLTLFVFVLMLFTLLVMGTLSKTLRKSSQALQETLGQITKTTDESLDGSLMLNLFRATDVWTQKFTKRTNQYKSIFDKVTRRQELSSPLSEFMGVTVVVVLLWYGAQLVFKGELRPEAFFAFVFAFYHVIEPLKSFSTAFYNIKKGFGSLDRINAIASTNVAENSEAGKRVFSFEQSIRFENVSYAYDQSPNRLVLDNLSFTLTKGEKLAIVGNSGAGKSTIISLLLKAIKPIKGSIYIDDLNLNEISADSLYQNLGVVGQSPFLFNDTIKENVLIGRSGISDTTINTALHKASAQEFVEGLPLGLATRVGDRGEQLSGGERQRVTIARALLEDPDILIFDEPTSALDPSAEQKVSSAIINALQERTALIIAHRLSTIQKADRIMFLEKGKIAELGCHEDLIKQQGRYNDYVVMQTML